MNHQSKTWERTGTRQTLALVSLKPETLAQATGPRLGETANSEGCWLRDFSLKRALLAWARPPLAQRWGSSFGLKLQRRAKVPMRSRLGEPLSPERDVTSLKWELECEPDMFLQVSLRREHQFLVTVSLQQPRIRIQTNIPSHFMHSQYHTSHRIVK